MADLSNNDGCVFTRSNETEALGFRIGNPYYLSRARIDRQQVAVSSSNHALHSYMSRRVIVACARSCRGEGG